ncbi:MAG: TIGR04282 family arsenosugar biosynthesis glycosyltransferase [Beijerinckiaceae bacterium]
MKPVHLVIFAKAPQPGFAKTRLIPALGATGAAALAARLLTYTAQQALAAQVAHVELCLTPAPDDPVWDDLARSCASLPESVSRTAQGEGDLGARMARAAVRIIAAEGDVLLIGTDCPGLTSERLREAAAALCHFDTTMIPAMDGGYTLLGLSRFDPSLFEGITWSTASVADETRRRVKALGWSLWEGAPLHDIDEPGDLRFLPIGWERPVSDGGS